MDKISVYKNIFKYAGKYKLIILMLILLSLFAVCFEVLKPLPVKFIIDNVLSGNPLPPYLQTFFPLPGNLAVKGRILITCIIALIVFIAGSASVSLYVSHCTNKVCQKMVHDLSVDLFNKLQQLSLSFYSKNKVGELLQRLSGDVYVVYSAVAHVLIPAVTSLASLFAMFYIMAKINFLLACIAISVVPALGVMVYFFNKPMSSSTIEQYSTFGQLNAFIQQSLSSIKIIQAYSGESYIGKKFTDHSKDYSYAFVNSTKISLTYVTSTSVITGITGVIVIAFGAYYNLHGQISVGDLFVFLGYIGALFGPVNSLASTFSTAITLGARGKRIFEILNSKEVVPEKQDGIVLQHVKGHVAFENVEFGYDPKGLSKILDNVSVNIPAGQIVAVVGSTGAGKTSMISLLLRIYDPWKGRILVDGADIADVKLSSLRDNISLVLQESFIFPVTIAENIAFGNQQATMNEIMEAAKTAQAHDFITKLPQGYQTAPGEGGISLSGGERQRIALARAFLKNAPILILDEPTSALDAQTEARIFNALAGYSRGKTVFVISHRLSTIRHADVIIVIKNGVIAEQGTHDYLLKKNHVYAALYKYL